LKKVYTIGLIIFLMLILLETCYGNQLTDYKIVYHNTIIREEPFGSMNMNLIIYCQGGQKFQIELRKTSIISTPSAPNSFQPVCISFYDNKLTHKYSPYF
jgi:hypothetical protein